MEFIESYEISDVQISFMVQWLSGFPQKNLLDPVR